MVQECEENFSSKLKGKKKRERKSDLPTGADLNRSFSETRKEEVKIKYRFIRT